MELAVPNGGNLTVPGGPKTTKGKQASRQNAVRHGLSAQTLLPEILGRGSIESAYQTLAREWEPTKAIERVLLREMARHQVALDRIELMEEAALRRGAQAAVGLALGTNEISVEDERDAALAGAGTADAIEKISRYRRPHEKGFYRSLSILQALRDAARNHQAPAETENTLVRQPSPAPTRFQTEAECETFLLARFESGQGICAHCGERGGRFLPSRKTWKCAGCERQVSLRAGTLMAGSHVGLLAWFRAIECVLTLKNPGLQELMTATGLERPGTLRRMAADIQKALASLEPGKLLAGLDAVFGDPRVQEPLRI